MEIKVVGIYLDGGDGSGTFNVYRDKEHYVETRMAEEAKSRQFCLDKGYKDYSKSQAEIEKEWDTAEAGDSPYEDGELATATIVLEETEEGWRLAKPFSLHWGQ